MNIKAHLVIVIALLAFSNPARANAELSGLQESKVVCPNKADKRVLSFDKVKSLWCDTTLSDFCKSRKKEAGYYACGKKYESALRKLVFESKEVSANSNVTKGLKKSNLKLIDNGAERLRLELELLNIQ